MATQTGGNREGLAKKNMELMLIPLPPLAEQHRVVAKVQQLQQQLSQLEAQVQQSRQYAQQLLQSVLKEAFGQKRNMYEENEELTMAAEP
jgi:type I restriction enzyme S subunit